VEFFIAVWISKVDAQLYAGSTQLFSAKISQLKPVYGLSGLSQGWRTESIAKTRGRQDARRKRGTIGDRQVTILFAVSAVLHEKLVILRKVFLKAWNGQSQRVLPRIKPEKTDKTGKKFLVP
jgi:hypothetical protein